MYNFIIKILTMKIMYKPMNVHLVYIFNLKQITMYSNCITKLFLCMDSMHMLFISTHVISVIQSYTVYIKSFEGENFHGFHGFLLPMNVLPLKIFLEYRCHPITTQSMVPPGLKFSTAKVFPTYQALVMNCESFPT